MDIRMHARRGQALLMMSFSITAMFGSMALVVDLGCRFGRQRCRQGRDCQGIEYLRRCLGLLPHHPVYLPRDSASHSRH